MNIEIIREFVLLSKYLNFTTTAKQCYISQSALSKHMSTLENKLGLELLVRSRGGSVGLTQTGKEFAEESERLILLYDAIMAKMADRRRSSTASLKIGYLEHASKPFLLDAIEAFSRNCPETNVSLTRLDGIEAAEALMHDEADLTISLTFDDINGEWYDQYEIFDDYYGLVVSEDHELAKMQQIVLSDLSGSDLVLALPDRDLHRIEWSYLYNELQRAGIELETHDCIQDLNDYTLFPLLKDCPAVMPMHYMDILDSRLRFVPIVSPYLHCSVSAIWKKKYENPTLRFFVEAIETTTRGMSTEVLRGMVEKA